jgi:hypothetical protein
VGVDKLGVWFVVVSAVFVIIESNVFFTINDLAKKLLAAKPIETTKGVIHTGFVLTILLYVGVELLLK